MFPVAFTTEMTTAIACMRVQLIIVILQVRQLSESAHRDAAPVAFTPRVQVGLHGTAGAAAAVSVSSARA